MTQKLNSKLTTKLTSEEKSRLQNLANKLGVSLNFLTRGLLNQAVLKLEKESPENISFNFGVLKSTTK